ncbi:MAG: hypothetical protein FJ147_08035 [Deltaproteobacteria bacterium]|nr:hypothetical protein [Deltaproteobacteria bacterium]
MTDTVKVSPRWLRTAIGLAVVAIIGVGSFFLWRSSPGYSVYRIKHALETHDYELLSRYVDVDKVLDYTLDELGSSGNDGKEISLGGFLGKLMRKGLFKLLTGEAREVTKAGLSLFVEQAVKDPDRPPPDIPAIAPVAAWWLAQREGDTARLTFETKHDQPINVTLQRTPEGVWRVVAISNLQVFLPKLQKHLEGLSRNPTHSE